jgi:hypothetical protein
MVASAPVAATASLTVSNTGLPRCSAALAGRDAADQVGAVGDGLLGVEGALLAGEALADDLGVLVDRMLMVVLFLGSWKPNARDHLAAAATPSWRRR